MIRSIATTCLIAMLAGPAMAQALPPAASDCTGLDAARAEARKVAAPLGYDVFDLDGESARTFQKTQDIPERDRVDHMTVMVNPKTGRAAGLLSNGAGCGFQSVYAVMSPPYTKAMDAALDLLRLAR